VSARLAGTTALVTGASRGIGAAIALRLAADGANVIVNYNGSEAAAAAVVAAIEAAGGAARAIKANVADAEACAELVNGADTAYADAPLMTVVNNAGITRDGLLVRMSDEDWGSVIDTNLSSVFYCTRTAAKLMMKRRAGSIVNVASVVGLVGNAGQANYAAAKAGIIGLTKAVARELAPRSVRVNAIAPGFIETDMTAELPQAACDAALASIAMKRFGKVEDVAALAAFLASDEAAYITGQTIAVDGGMTFA
jgi:3-oxoacyl-[acyl-carrier protein] reductase